jgi:hypothetical protein
VSDAEFIFILYRIKSSFVNTHPELSETPLCKGFELGWVLAEHPPNTQPKTHPNTPPSLFLACFDLRFQPLNIEVLKTKF